MSNKKSNYRVFINHDEKGHTAKIITFKDGNYKIGYTRPQRTHFHAIKESQELLRTFLQDQSIQIAL